MTSQDEPRDDREPQLSNIHLYRRQQDIEDCTSTTRRPIISDTTLASTRLSYGRCRVALLPDPPPVLRHNAAPTADRGSIVL